MVAEGERLYSNVLLQIARLRAGSLPEAVKQPLAHPRGHLAAELRQRPAGPDMFRRVASIIFRRF